MGHKDQINHSFRMINDRSNYGYDVVVRSTEYIMPEKIIVGCMDLGKS